MPCLLAAGRDESAKGGVFACACSALLNIHRRCLDALMSPPCSGSGSHGSFLAWDAASVMARERARVLQGCVLQLASCAASLRVCPSAFACSMCATVADRSRLSPERLVCRRGRLSTSKSSRGTLERGGMAKGQSTRGTATTSPTSLQSPLIAPRPSGEFKTATQS